MNKLLASLPMRQRITIAVTVLLAAGGLYALVHWKQEADFRPLFTGLAAEDAAGIVQKLKEGGVEYRIPDEGGAVLVPSSRRAELRLSLAAAGLPKSGRIGFELFDKTNLGATEFTEHVNYGRALEGELERSVMSLTEVDQARVHISFPKDSVFLDAQKPAKASVLVRLKPGARLSPQNVQAIDHLVAAAVDGLSPDGVSVLDMNGNLLGRPRAPGSIDGPEPSEAGLDYRRKIEADLVAKVNSTLEPLLGAEKFHAGVSVDCDFNGGEQSEEVFDPARSVMLSSQRTEDTSGVASGSGVPGTASTLPRPTSRPGTGASRVARVTENVTYQSTRTIKKMRLPAGAIRKISVAVLVDQQLTWEKEKNGFRRVLVPPSAEKLKVIHDMVAGVTGFNAERGDQLVVETQPFETTLTLDPPLPPGAAVPGRPGQPEPAKLLQLDQKTLLIGGGVLAAVIVVLVLFLRRGSGRAASVSVPFELPAGPSIPSVPASEHEVRSRLAEHDAQQKEAEAQAALKLVPAITKTAEVMAKHLREKISQSPEVSVQVLRGWIRDEDTER
jgi:flagellar M-ring protein FliF